MLKFPRLVYSSPSIFLCVNDAKEYEAAINAGWFSTVPEATAPRPAIVQQLLNEAPKDDAPPTRDELEIKAKELGIKFDGRTTDAKLARMIAESLSG